MDDQATWMDCCDELLPVHPCGSGPMLAIMAVAALLLAVTGCGAAALAAWSQIMALAGAAAS